MAVLSLKLEREVDEKEIDDFLFGTGCLEWGWWGNVVMDPETQTITIRHDGEESKEGAHDETTVISFQHLLDQFQLAVKNVSYRAWEDVLADSIGLLDAMDADAVLQLAVFGKTVFG